MDVENMIGNITLGMNLIVGKSDGVQSVILDRPGFQMIMPGGKNGDHDEMEMALWFRGSHI
jgi:hypothetical protein